MEKKSQAEVILKQLLETHFFTKDLEWRGKSLKESDFELYIQIITNFPEILNSK